MTWDRGPGRCGRGGGKAARRRCNPAGLHSDSDVKLNLKYFSVVSRYTTCSELIHGLQWPGGSGASAARSESQVRARAGGPHDVAAAQGSFAVECQ